MKYIASQSNSSTQANTLKNYTSIKSTQRLDECKIIRRKEKETRKKPHLAVVFVHNLFPDKELYCKKYYTEVTSEVPQDFLFESNAGLREGYKK